MPVLPSCLSNGSSLAGSSVFFASAGPGGADKWVRMFWIPKFTDVTEFVTAGRRRDSVTVRTSESACLRMFRASLSECLVVCDQPERYHRWSYVLYCYTFYTSLQVYFKQNSIYDLVWRMFLMYIRLSQHLNQLCIKTTATLHLATVMLS